MSRIHEKFATTPVFIVVVGLLLVAGCAGKGLRGSTPPPLDAEAEARFSAISPARAMADLERRMAAAEEVRLDRFAPAHMARARRAFEGARRALEDGAARAVYEWVAVAEEALEGVHVTRREVERQLAAFFESKAALIRARADRYRLHTFRKLMDRGDRLIALVEEQRQAEARQALPALLAEMAAFEIDAIVHYALDPAAQALDEARQVGAAELAPRSFEKARTAYRRAEREIRANPHAGGDVARVADEALREARHAFFVARRVAALRKIKHDRLERIVLEEEGRLAQVARALRLGAIHDRSLEDQARILAASARRLHARYEALVRHDSHRLPAPAASSGEHSSFAVLPEQELSAPAGPHLHGGVERP